VDSSRIFPLEIPPYIKLSSQRGSKTNKKIEEKKGFGG
jgi:hypothetical protein